MTQIYELGVPLEKSGDEGAESRYGCCYRTETLGHSKACLPEARARYIEGALARAGIAFRRCREEDKQPDPLSAPLHDSATTAVVVDEIEGKPASWVRLVQDGKVLAEFEIRETPCELQYSAEPMADASVRFTLLEKAEDENRFAGGRFGRVGEGASAKVSDPVNHPAHYCSHPAGIECTDVNEHMTANIAAAMKYVWRAGLKPGEEHDRDLAKAVWYIERERVRVRTLA